MEPADWGIGIGIGIGILLGLGLYLVLAEPPNTTHTATHTDSRPDHINDTNGLGGEGN